MGKAVGIVTTARMTHATPAAVYAKTVHRDWEDDSALPDGCAQKDIAAQFFDAMQAGTVDFAMGGGRQHFVPAGTTVDEETEGKRADGRNLIEEAKAAGAQYAWNDETFAALNLDGSTPVLGTLRIEPYEVRGRPHRRAVASQMTEAAIEYLPEQRGRLLPDGGGRPRRPR